MNKKALWIGVIVVIVLAAAVFALTKNKNNSNNNAMDMSHSSTATTTQSSPSANPEDNAVATMAVTISDFSFAPGTIKVKAGDTVTWTNKDSTSHTVTADVKTADAPDGPSIAQNETYSFTFKKAGTYTYHCSIHPSMRGTVIVQ
jgi:amicyanin